MNDQELDQLLRQWKAPGAPASLQRKVLPRRSVWAWLLGGSIRIPVPVALAAGMLLAVWWFASRSPSAAPVPPATASGSVSLAEFEPVKELKVRVMTVGGQR